MMKINKTGKKISCLLLSFLLVFAFLPGSPGLSSCTADTVEAAGNTEKDNTEKDNTEKDSTEKDSTEKDSTEKDSTEKDDTEEDDSIHISDAQDLKNLAENAKLDSWSKDKTVVLDNDIDLNNEEFTPIIYFNGKFDGQDHTISGLRITGSGSYTGLFGTIGKSGKVENLNVSGSVNPSGKAENVGGIAGINEGVISGCSFNGVISGSENTGSIVGKNESTGTVRECKASGNIIGKSMTGGIAGYNSGILFNCENNSAVNTVNEDGNIDLSDLSLSFSIDLSSVSSLDLADAATDTGGITGYSDGNILGCINSGAVGYAHVGYNVGGIAGRSCGYLLSCSNHGVINGRKDVGGIIGQMEPNVDETETVSSLKTLRDQMDKLNELMDQTQEDARNASQAIQDQISSMGSALNSAAGSLSDITTTITGGASADASGEAGASTSGSSVGADAAAQASGSTRRSTSLTSGSTSGNGSSSASFTGSYSGGSADGKASGNITGSVDITANTNLGGIRSALKTLGNQIGGLSGSLGSESGKLDDDLTAINKQLDEIYNTTFDTIDNLTASDLISDTSDVGIDDLTFGKASLCDNDGTIQGDLNVGGIAGIMAQEYSVDPEDDLTQSIDVYEKKSYEVKAVVFKCVNRGTVTAKHDYAGGITGRADLGFLYQNENYGNITSESGSYVGGTAGLNTTNIRSCYAKCSLSGESYVGGISGSGIQENVDDTSSQVYDCAALVGISNAAEYYGAISGTEEGTYARNYFVSQTLAGLNQLNSKGKAEPVSFEKLLEISGIPDEFSSLTVTFRVNGEVFDTISVPYGGSISDEDLPAVPDDGDTYCRWSQSDFSAIYTDMDVEAVYSDYTTALSAGGSRSDGRDTLFVEGNFTKDQTITADLLNTKSGEVKSQLPMGTLVMDVGESWSLQIPDDGLTTHNIRYLMPNENNRFIRIYQKDGDGYKQLKTEEIGSYLSFEAEGNEVEFAAVKVFPWKYVVLAAAIAAAAVLLLIFLLTTLAVHRRRKKKKDEEARKEEMESRHQAEMTEAEAKEQELIAKNEKLLKEMEADPNISPALLEMTRRSMDNEVRMMRQDRQIRMLRNQLKMQNPDAYPDTDDTDSAGQNPVGQGFAGQNAADRNTAGAEDRASADQNQSPADTGKIPAPGRFFNRKAAGKKKAADPRQRRKHIRRFFLIFNILLLFVIGTAAAMLISRPAFFNEALCAAYMKELTLDESLEMDMNVTVSVDEEEISSSIGIARAKADDGTDVTIAGLEDTSFYYADSVIYLENGNAWSVSDLCPDYGELTELLKDISEHTDIDYYTENSAGCYEFSSTDEDAQALFEMLCPAEASDVEQLNNLEMVVKVLARKVSEIDFTGEAALSSGKVLNVTAVCEVIPKKVRTAQTVPSAVSEAIAQGDAAPKAKITADMLTLLMRMGSTISQNPLTADITVGADCGILNLDTSFSYTRTTTDGSTSNEIDMNGMTICFEDGSSDATDANGNPVESDLADLAESTRLIDLVWNLCMTTEASCEKTDSGEVFAMSLDDDTMKQAVLDIAPSLDGMNLSFEDGTVTLKTDGSKVTEISFSCSGTVKALIGEASAELSARIDFTDNQ